MTDTATVETLTAEVRVLMVGNRQITLSVARQLDVVGLNDLEPFGRVQIDKKYPKGDVIGRCLSTGALALAHYRTSFQSVDTFEYLTGKVTVCGSMTPMRMNGDAVYNLRYDDRSIIVSEENTESCGIEDHQPYFPNHADYKMCSGWGINGFDAEIQAAIDAQDAIDEPHRVAAKLPLIVLAGLR